VNGEARFTGLKVTVAGSYKIRVRSGNLVLDIIVRTVGRQT
jgi:hypothetical protein